MATDCTHQLTFWDIGRQQVSVDLDGGSVVGDAGLLPLRLLDRQLGVLADVAQRWPDPRVHKFVTHSREALLTQEFYQILAGYPDGNDAQALGDDPLRRVGPTAGSLSGCRWRFCVRFSPGLRRLPRTKERAESRLRRDVAS
jgi:hypothetical protein